MAGHTASAFWRRLDSPGHDAAWLERTAEGWLLHGAAVFREDAPASLVYAVACDAEWVTLWGEVRGRVGDERIDYTIDRAGGAWAVNGKQVAGLSDLVDLDFGFTPATNLLQLRRVGLAVGATAEIPVAWFDGVTNHLTRLPQRYERRTEETYWYESPPAGYSGELVVGPDGFALQYPGLWEAERLR